MAYSTELERRVEETLTGEPELEKKKMFGGVGYLLNGNICFGIYQDFLILRTTAENAAVLLRKEGFKPFDITGSAMKGWVMAYSDTCSEPDMLKYLTREGIRFASTLPAKMKS